MSEATETEVCVMSILNSTGDSRFQWRKTDPDETATARSRFDELRARGFAAFKVNAQGSKGEQIDAFDPTAERMIMVPPMVGG